MSRGRYASLNLGRSTPDAAEDVAENRARLAAALGLGPVVFPRQVHGREVRAVADPADAPGACDALVTAEPGVALGVLGADCPGVLFVAPERRLLAVAHAGWRGVAAGVVPAVLEHLQLHHRVRPRDLLVAIGPGIGPARYEVDDAVAARLAGAYGAPRLALTPGRPGHAHADLVLALRLQLRHAGVPDAQVACTGGCTYDEPGRWFSHRRDGGDTGRHALVAGWTA